MSEIVVGVPTLNEPWRLERCLKSIATSTELDNVRVVVCDDGSRDDTLRDIAGVVERMRQTIGGLVLLQNNARLGIAKTWNRLTRYDPNAQIVALINDDVEVVPHWLDVLAFSVRENPPAGMVGLNSYVALTKEQHDKLHPNALPHERIPIIEYRQAHLLDAGGELMWAPGNIFAFRREAFDTVGGFDERFFVFYEEVDFGLRLRLRKLLSFVADYPIVYHMGGATMSDPANLNASERLLESRRLFVDKWGKSSSQLREELRADYIRPRLREWNSQTHNHRD